jgi:hypothetical protein
MVEAPIVRFETFRKIVLMPEAALVITAPAPTATDPAIRTYPLICDYPPKPATTSPNNSDDLSLPLGKVS